MYTAGRIGFRIDCPAVAGLGTSVGTASSTLVRFGRLAASGVGVIRTTVTPQVIRLRSGAVSVGALVRVGAAVARERWVLFHQTWNEARMMHGQAGDRVELEFEPNLLHGEVVRDGKGVRLRTQVPANRASFQRWYADPEIARLLRHDQEPLTEIQSRGYFDTIILPLSARGLCFAIHEVETDLVIGMSALTELQPGPATALFRIVIGEKDRWGRGYGTEATRLVAQEAFERFGLREVRLEVFRHNPRALGTYIRVGFEIIGEHVEWVPRQGLKLDVVEMRLKRDDFWRREAELMSDPLQLSGH